MNIYLANTTRDRLDQLAKRRGVARSTIIAKALEDCLPGMEAEQAVIEAYRGGIALGVKMAAR